jgi:hypothetical protein
MAGLHGRDESRPYTSLRVGAWFTTPACYNNW